MLAIGASSRVAHELARCSSSLAMVPHARNSSILPPIDLPMPSSFIASLPLAMGARVGLLRNAFTPAYEQTYLEAHPRGAVLSRVEEIPEFAFGN